MASHIVNPDQPVPSMGNNVFLEMQDPLDVQPGRISPSSTAITPSTEEEPLSPTNGLVPELHTPRHIDDVPHVNLLQTLAKWCLGSSLYFMLCVVMVIANAGVIVWMIANDSDQHRVWWIVTIEVVVTVVVFLEVICHLYAAGPKAYFSQCTNTVDFAVMILCVLAFVEYVTRLWDDVDELEEVVIALRYTVQIFRLAILIRITHKEKHMNEHSGDSTNQIRFAPKDRWAKANKDEYPAEGDRPGPRPLAGPWRMKSESLLQSIVHEAAEGRTVTAPAISTLSTTSPTSRGLRLSDDSEHSPLNLV